MAATIEQAKQYKAQALDTINKAQAKMDEYEGKSIPADVSKQIDDLFAAGDDLARRAELTQKSAEAQKWREMPDDLKRLETPQGQLKPEEGHEEDWGKVMEKYGLSRWQIKDMKGTMQSIDRAYRHSWNMLKQAGAMEGKAYAETGATSGSTITADIFVPEFVNKLYLASHLRQAGSRIVPLKGDITRYPRMTTASAKADLIAEAGAATAVNATLGEQCSSTPTCSALLQQASIEIVADAEFDILSEIILPDMAQQFAAAENSFFTTGTGSGQPRVIVAGLSVWQVFGFPGRHLQTTITLTVSSTSPTPSSPQYRTGPKCAYMMHDSIMAKVFRKVKAVSGGTYIWEPSQQVGQPDTIYGKPVYYNQSMTSAGSSATNLAR
jgi:HK97 family phage major capsid protein